MLQRGFGGSQRWWFYFKHCLRADRSRHLLVEEFARQHATVKHYIRAALHEAGF